VPIIVWGPRVVDRLGASASPLELSDVRGMLLALAGVARDPLAGLLTRGLPEPRRDGARLRSVELDSEKAIYQKSWKYIVTRSPFRERLFNLDKDHAEQVDRSLAEPRVLARLRATAQRWWPDIYNPSPASGESRSRPGRAPALTNGTRAR
jgi:hypothetical protein